MNISKSICVRNHSNSMLQPMPTVPIEMQIFVVIATPTNYDPVRNYFDTVHVEEVIERVLQVNPNAIMVIKSTVPVGYTEGVRRRYDCNNFLFAPEFFARK